MARGHGKIHEEFDRLNADRPGADQLDTEHELPANDGEQPDARGNPVEAASVTTEGTEDQIEKLRAENRAYLDRLSRLQAEFDNFRKRSAREQQEYRDYALADALKQLLPILDSLDRALKTQTDSTGDFRSGIELIDRQFHDVLAKLGVEPVTAKGAHFDPKLHQAIQMVPTNAVPDNHVVEELQRGYRLRDRLLRPAMVLVAQNSKQ